MICLEQKISPKWTLKHLEFMKQHSEECYGLKFDKNWYLEQKNKINLGNPDSRIEDGQVLYEIYDDINHIGDITISIDLKIKELSISIFDEYSGKGYAKKAIEIYINLFHDNKYNLRGRILLSNRNIVKMQKIFSDLNFEKIKFRDNILTLYYDYEEWKLKK